MQDLGVGLCPDPYFWIVHIMVEISTSSPQTPCADIGGCSMFRPSVGIPYDKAYTEVASQKGLTTSILFLRGG